MVLQLPGHHHGAEIVLPMFPRLNTTVDPTGTTGPPVFIARVAAAAAAAFSTGLRLSRVASTFLSSTMH